MMRRLIVGMVFLGLMLGLAGTARAGTDLNLLGGRFRVSAEWRTGDGANGAAQALPLTGEAGLFWFFSQGNVELVVKILDACVAPYDRFWFHAAGLTDVEVEILVEDTWTGQSKTYLRPLGQRFAPIADTSTFNGCGVTGPPPACGQGTSAEIAATPRPNPEAEALALLLGPGITADPAIYGRLDADLAQIRTLWPSLAHVGFPLIWWPSDLIIDLTPSAWAAVKAGQFTEWDCLNHWYNGEVSSVSTYSPWALIHFEGFFHPSRIGIDYEALPGVVNASANGLSYPSGEGFLNDLCATIDGTVYDYFLYDGSGQGRTWYFRVPDAGATPVLIGSAGGPGDLPDWWPRYEQCREDLAQAAYP